MGYSALKSWIPGGTVQEYVWNLGGGPQLHDDWNTFVFTDPSQAGLRHLCLTVNGTRVSPTDPSSEESASATICGWTIHFNAAAGGLAHEAGLGRPNVGLTQLSESGALEVVGHTSPWAGTSAGATANVIVHFPDSKSVAHLDFLRRALLESGRNDTATAIIGVLAADQLAKVKATQGIVFADDHGAWERLFKVKHRPATFVVGTSGNVVWHYQGELTSADLAAALKKYLVAGGVFSPRLLQSSVRIGQPTPNFLFEYAPGRQLTLHKLAGRAVVLVFWKSTSQPSLETFRDLQKAFSGAGRQGPVVLAINDGEAPELAKKFAAEHRLSAIVVPDPARQISLAYGVNVWPTAIFIDAGGLAKDVRYGRFSGELVKYPSPGKTAAARTSRK